MICKIHGECEFTVEKQDKHGKVRHRCKQCGYLRQYAAKRRRKQELVDMKGGGCLICGYNKYVGALDFHHLNPLEKEFEIGQGLLSLSKAKLVAEANKCVLLCKNCHCEVEAGQLVLDKTYGVRSVMV